MHVQALLWEILALWSMAEGEQEDGAHPLWSLEKTAASLIRCVFNKKLVSQMGCEDKLIDLFHRRTKCLSLLPVSYALGYSWLRTL